MKTLFTIACIILVASSLYASSGEELYKEANCQRCHGGEGMYDPLNEKVKSMQDLKGWVSGCATNLNTGWFPEEESEVVKYLNETHYKLKK